MHASRVSWWKWRWRRGFASHHAAHTALRESNVADVTPPGGSVPSVALKDLLNPFSFQSVRRLDMANGTHRVRSSAESFAEGRSGDVADPVRHAALIPGLARQLIHGCGGKIH